MLDGVREAIQGIQNLEGFAARINPQVALARDILLSQISVEEPRGHVEEIYNTTVSKRIGHKPISEGWRTSIEEIDGGVSLSVRNVSQHILAVLKGVPPHREPKKGYALMYFWWGFPHRWPARDGGVPGERMFMVVSHPGTAPNPFVARAKQAARLEMKDAIAVGVRNYIRQAFLEHGLKET